MGCRVDGFARIGQVVSEVHVRQIKQVPRSERRLELLCVHGNLREILAVVARDELVTNLDVWRYPDDLATVSINCKTCRRHWRLPMARLRERVDARHGLEKVAISELAAEASWLD